MLLMLLFKEREKKCGEWENNIDDKNALCVNVNNTQPCVHFAE